MRTELSFFPGDSAATVESPGETPPRLESPAAAPAEGTQPPAESTPGQVGISRALKTLSLPLARLSGGMGLAWKFPLRAAWA